MITSLNGPGQRLGFERMECHLQLSTHLGTHRGLAQRRVIWTELALSTIAQDLTEELRRFIEFHKFCSTDFLLWLK